MDLPNDGVFTRVERLYLPRWKSWLQSAMSLPTKTPMQVAYFSDSTFRRRAAALMSEHDATLTHLIRTGDAIKDLPGLKFLEMTDAISLNYERVRRMGSTSVGRFRSMVFSLESRRLRKYEMNIVDHFDHSFLVSEIDRSILFENNPERLNNVSVFSNGVDLSTMPFNFHEDAKEIVFIGNMNSLQNFDAVMFMARDVMPIVVRTCPSARLRVIGRIQPSKAAELRILPNVDVTGEVQDIALSAASGAVGVCPLRLGAGVQNKVLEYMALGLPVISTTMGLEGFAAQPGQDLLVADTVDDFAAATVALLQDRAVARRISVSARRYVEEHHSWDSVLSPLVNLICDRIESRRY